MKSLQLRYGLLQALYCFTTCSGSGFAAIFLGYKGLSNTLIGITTGAACVSTIFIAPLISMAIARVPRLSISRAIMAVYAVAGGCFLLVSFAPLPAVLIMVLYALTYASLISITPFLAQLAMDYNRIGQPINFGLARGTGSITYAVAAVGLSLLVERLNPDMLAIVTVTAAIAFVALLRSMPVCEKVRTTVGNREPADSLFVLLRKRPLLFGVLAGFMFAFIGTTCLSIYLIDIVQNVGGDTSMFGVAVFCMAASELPAMTLVPRLRRTFSTGTLFAVAGVAYLIRNLTVVFAPNVELVFFGLLFQSMSYGMLTPLITYYISEECGPRNEMTGQTALSVMTTGIGSMLGTVVGGVVQDTWGIGAMLGFVAIATVVGASILIAIGMRVRGVELARRA